MLIKIFLKVLAAVFINFLMISAAQASIETVTGSGEYIMSMKETPEFAQQNAKLYAERAAIEKAGVFISSFSVSKNSELQEDEITSFAAGLLKNINVAKIEMIPLTGEAAGYIKVIVIVEAQIDSADFETALKTWKNREGNARANLIEQNNALQKLVDEQAKRIKELEQNLANIKTAQDKQNIQQEILAIDKDALYIQKIDEGWKLYDKKNFYGAAEIFTQAINLKPNDYQAYFGRGTAFSALKNYAAAISDLNKTIQINKNYADAYHNRGTTYFYLKQYDAAISDFTRAIAINPKLTHTYNNRGIAYVELKNYAAALSDCNKAIKLKPNCAETFNNRGIVYFHLQQYGKAISDYNKAIEINSNSAYIFNNRGNAYAKLKNYAAALSDYDRAIKLKPNYADAYNNRSVIYSLRGNFQQAIKDLTRAVEFNPNEAKIYQLRGLCYQALGETKKANADFAKAKKLGYTE